METNTPSICDVRKAAVDFPQVSEPGTRPAGWTLTLWIGTSEAAPDRLSVSILVTSRLGRAVAVFDTLQTASRADRPAAEDIDPDLLQSVQTYLSCLRRNVQPDEAARDAWNRFFTSLQPFVRRAVLGCFVPSADTEDCIQDAWLEIAQKLPDFRYDPARGRFHGWLHRLIRRRTLKSKRRLASSSTSPADFDPNTVRCLRCEEPSAACEQRDTRQQFHIALEEFRAHVPTTTFRILELISLEQRTVAEVVQRLRITPQQVWTYYHRARVKLRRFLEQRQSSRNPEKAAALL